MDLQRAILFDGGENYVADLNVEKLETEEIIGLDGEFRLIAKYPYTEEDSKEIMQGHFIAIDDPEGAPDEYLLFEIVGLDDQMDYVTITCNHDYYQLGKGELVSFQTDGDNSDIALIHVLQNELYQLGTVEIDRPLKRSRINKNPLECIRYIEKEWGGEMKFRIVITGANVIERYVDHLTRIGSKVGTRFEFGHNIDNYNHVIETDHIVTAMYGFGKGESIEGEDTQKLTFADYEWSIANGDPADKPIGQNWIGDPNALALYGRPDGNGGRKHKFGKYDSQSETMEGLIWETWRELNLQNTPLVNVEAEFKDLGAVNPLFTHERARIGDTHYFIADVNGRPIQAEVRIVKINRKRKQPNENQIELGNFLPVGSDAIVEIEKRVQDYESRKGVYDEMASGAIDGSRIEGIIDGVQAEIHNSQAYIYQDRKGILLLNDDINANPTEAMLLSGGKFFLSNERDINGAWIWRTFGDGSGFIADEVVAGTLKTDLVEIMGDVNFRWNGQNLYMIDPNDSNKQIRFGRYDGENYGLGFTKDGGATWQSSFDFDGLHVGAQTVYEEGYDPSTKETPSGAQNKADQAEADAKQYTEEQLGNYVKAVAYDADMNAIQAQIDNQITSHFKDYAPTLTNAPASEWTTTDEKNQHIGDLFFDTTTGYSYRYALNNGVYAWIQVRDEGIGKALQDASEAQDTADSKRRVFVNQPTTPYDIGDLWTRDGELLRSAVDKTSSGTFSLSDWILVGDITNENTSLDTENVAGRPATEIEDKTGAQEKADQAEANAKEYAEPTIKELYDAGFQHGNDFWANSHVGEELPSTNTGVIVPSPEADLGGNLLSISGGDSLYSKNAIPVNTDRVYQVTFKIRQTVDSTIVGESRVYAGVATLDENFNAITGGAGSHRYCAVAGTAITVADGWQIFSGLITGEGDLHENFRPNTTYIRPMCLVNYQGGDGTVEIDYLKCEDVTEMKAIEQRVSEVEFRTTEDSIIQSVTNSVEYKQDLESKVGAEFLENNYVDNDTLDQTKADLEESMDVKITELNLEETYATKSFVEQTANAIDFKFSSSGGVNLLQNSVGFAGTDFWFTELAEDGTSGVVIGEVDTLQNAELKEQGAGSAFVLRGAKLTQEVSATSSFFTIATKVRKGTAGSGYLKVHYDDKVETVSFDVGVEYDFEPIQIIVEPVGNVLLIEMYGDLDSDMLFTSTMVNVGNVALQWQHSAGEIYNTNVLMDSNGVRVMSNSYNGYTAITPEEFAGYAEVNGVMTRVFTLNKDVTEMSKIRVEKEIAMTPIKIIPVKSTNYNGWAFIAEE